MTTTTTLLIRARQHACGSALDTIAASIAALNARHAESLQASHDFERESPEDLADRLVAGDDIPADLADQIHSLYQANEARVRERKLLTDTISVLEGRRTDIERSTTEDALDFIRAELADVLAIAADCAKHLRGITSGDDAIRAGGTTAAAWKKMITAVDRYTEIREAQRTIIKAARGTGGFSWNEFHRVAITRGYTDPEYLVRTKQAEVGGYLSNGHARLNPEPWPARSNTVLTAVIPSDDPVAYLAWLAERGDAWIPNDAQMAAASEERATCIQHGLTPDQIEAVRLDAERHRGKLQSSEQAFEYARQRLFGHAGVEAQRTSA